jgi:integrase
MPISAEENVVLLEEVRRIRELVDPSIAVNPKRFEEACEEFAADQLERRRSARTVESNLRILRQHFDGKMLHEITLLDLQVFVRGRLKDVIGSTINRNRATLSRLFNWAIDRGYAGTNPVSRLKKLKESPGRLRFLSADEASRLQEAAARHLKPVLAVALATGGRLGELLALRWQDIDTDAGVLTFRRETTKSGKERMVPLNDEILRTLKLMRLGGAHEPPCLPQDRIFRFHGTGIKSVRTSFNKARRKANVQGICFHTLRHTFASWYVQNGGDPYRLQKFLGHSTIAMTQRYAHLSREYLLEGVQYIGPPRPPESKAPPSPGTGENGAHGFPGQAPAAPPAAETEAQGVPGQLPAAPLSRTAPRHRAVPQRRRQGFWRRAARAISRLGGDGKRGPSGSGGAGA